MSLIIIALSIIIIGGFLALILCKNSPLSTILGAGSTVIGCLIGSFRFKVLINGNVETIHLVWDMPYASFFLKLDPLSAFFFCRFFFLPLWQPFTAKNI